MKKTVVQAKRGEDLGKSKASFGFSVDENEEYTV